MDALTPPPLPGRDFRSLFSGGLRHRLKSGRPSGPQTQASAVATCQSRSGAATAGKNQSAGGSIILDFAARHGAGADIFDFQLLDLFTAGRTLGKGGALRFPRAITV